MATLNFVSYDEAAKAYLMRFHDLRDAPLTKVAASTRGEKRVDVESVIAASEDIADISAAMIPLASAYLDSPDPSLREGISRHLLAQVAAELQVANELLLIAPGDKQDVGSPVARGVRVGALQNAIDAMSSAMAIPLVDGLLPAIRLSRRGVLPDKPEAAKAGLKNAAITTSTAITLRVSDVGGDMAFKLVFNTDWAEVIHSASFVSKDVARLLDQIKAGIGATFQRAVVVAARLLANAYDKILALLGKELEGEARKRIGSWLEGIKDQGKIDLFAEWIRKLYRVGDFETELYGWLENTDAGVDQINQVTGVVNDVADKFTLFVKRLDTVGNVIGLARFIQLPQVLAIATAIRTALLAVLVYAGYDYVGFGEPRFPNFSKGVGEIVREGLNIAA